MNKFLFSIIISLSTIGLINATTLYFQYQQYINSAQPIMCFVGNSCVSVLDSKYGKTFGIKNEIFGIGYYLLLIGLVIVTYFNKLRKINHRLIIKVLSIGAASFSLYLLGIQEFVLHQFCFRCLIAIAINMTLLVATLWIKSDYSSHNSNFSSI